MEPGARTKRRGGLNLVLITNPRINQRADFERLAGYLVQETPAVRPVILADRLVHLRHSLALAFRPTMVFSPARLCWFRPLRGAVFQGQPLTKSEELSALEAHGLPVPKWTLLTPTQRPDLDGFGPYVVLKPDRGGRGADVKIKRKTRVRWTRPRTEFAARLARDSADWIVQEFTYTGPWPVSYRVATLFGQVLWSSRVEADHCRRPLSGRYEFGRDGGGRPIVAGGRGCTYELNYDQEIIALAEKAQAAFPRIPLLGVDILREEPSGKLFIIEVNAVGFTWHFSSPVGLHMQKTGGFRFESQFDGLRKAARILGREAQRHAR